MQTLLWLQDSTLGVWLRESDWAIFACLIAHTIGMAFAVGAGFIVVARVLGVPGNLPLTWLPRLKPVAVCGLIAVLLSGIGLVIAYPAKALTNPLFYFKLLELIVACVIADRQVARIARTNVVDRRERTWAIVTLMLWIGGVTAGKLLAYTHTMLLVYGD